MTCKSTSETDKHYQQLEDPGLQSDRAHGFGSTVKDNSEMHRLSYHQHAEENRATSPHEHVMLILPGSKTKVSRRFAKIG